MKFRLWFENSEEELIKSAVIGSFPDNFDPRVVLTSELRRIDGTTKANLRSLGILTNIKSDNPQRYSDLIDMLDSPIAGATVNDFIKAAIGKGEALPAPQQRDDYSPHPPNPSGNVNPMSGGGNIPTAKS